MNAEEQPLAIKQQYYSILYINAGASKYEIPLYE
jgi:hypothetical protein